MEEFIKAITPLLSVMIGGFITYFVTALSKNNELSLKAKIDARDRVWIPLCITLENVFDNIQNETKDIGDFVAFSNDGAFKNEVTELFKYLKAENRLLLCKRTRSILEDCQLLINNYENEIEKHVKNTEFRFRQLYSEMMEKHPIYIKNHCMDLRIATSKELKNKIRKCIISSYEIKCFGMVTSLTFVINDDEENYRTIDVSLSEKFYHDIWSPLQSGYVGEDELDITHDDDLSIEVADFEDEHIYNIDRKINALAKACSLCDMYNCIFENLTELRKEVYKNIDSITRIG